MFKVEQNGCTLVKIAMALDEIAQQVDFNGIIIVIDFRNILLNLLDNAALFEQIKFIFTKNGIAGCLNSFIWFVERNSKLLRSGLDHRWHLLEGKLHVMEVTIDFQQMAQQSDVKINFFVIDNLLENVKRVSSNNAMIVCDEFAGRKSN